MSNRYRRAWISGILGACMTLWPLAGPRAPAAQPAGKLQVLVLSGGHGYPVEPFRKVFAGFADMQCTFLEEKEGGEAFDDVSAWPYRAMVLYNFEKKPNDKRWNNFLTLLDRGVGVVILHHGIYAYRSRPEFQKMVGVTSWLSAAKHGMKFTVHIEDPKHPITQGLKDFVIHDETYQGHGTILGVHVILTTDHPENSKAVAWVHKVRNSRVCYFQLGHDHEAYAAPEFGIILGRAIRWSAGYLDGE